MAKNKINCKYFEDATIFDMDFNEIEYKYCTLFDDECKKIRKTKKCVYNLKQQLKHTKQVLQEVKDTLNKIFNVCDDDCGNASEITNVVNRINEVLK